MTPEEARERFSEAFEGELTSDQRAEFDAALESDAELRREYESFRQTMDSMRALGTEQESAGQVDLLAGVQRKLRGRSRGRYYRDRFSERSRAQSMVPLLVGLLVLIVITAVLVGLHFVTIEPESSPSPAKEQSSPSLEHDGDSP